ncbi:PBP1A family penicillin-binding protein [Bacillus shivajii]|uniref:transglycosylase domain-containing protein n=1 Tax=Bacillus shivajii TaxID=1983719 RepID=UPI001CFA805E|nr:penicillin-binding protein 1A [Bacillus shivajii]UCZ54820.1 PBP1A family penicillin-binding protein [Bacillus shivajii]
MSDEYRTRQERRKVKQSSNNNSKSKRKPKGALKKILLALGIVMFVMFVVGAISVFAIIRDAPPLDEEKLTLAQNPEILDRNGELLTTLQASENRRNVNIEDVPDVLKDAVLSVEDVRFYDHFGIDLRRIGGAVVANVRGGFGAEGASTITQQVVKNLFLSMDKQMSRKIQEQYLAIRLEQQYTKDQILEMYLNAIFFSGSPSQYGVVSAANYYFNKELDELTIEDAALLAGIPQRPNHFNPFNNPEAAENRRNTVISLMERHEKITPEEAEAARNVPVEDQLEQSEQLETGAYQAFINQVQREVENIEGIEPSDIYTAGMTIHTTLDQDLQAHVEHVMQSGEVIQYPDEHFQAGITVLDTTNGEVLALGGMREPSEAQRTYNWATQPKRQPGSSIKPILSFGPVIEELKWSTYHQIVDEPYNYQTTGDPVRNFGRDYRGPMSMREALRISQNVPAVKALNEVGYDQAQTFGQRLGLPLDTFHESYALGGFDTGVSSYDMAGAYAAFGNNGEYNEPHTVRKIEFPDGQTIDLTPDSTIAMNDYTAFMVTDMLKTVVQSGTGQRAAVSGVPIAGKTGSTNFTPDEREQYNIQSGIRDAWFAGYSTNITAAVWTGYESIDKGYIAYDNHQEFIARDLFREVMTFAHQNRDTSDFTQPDSVVRVGIERSTGLLPSDFTPESEIIHEYFVRGTEPTDVSDEYEQAEPVQGLQAEYNEDDHEIQVNWSYNEEFIDQFSFKLELRSNNDEEYQLIDITKDLGYILSNPEYDTTYSIRVTAVADENEDLTSDPATVEVTVPEEQGLLDELDDLFEGDDESDEDNGRGNGRGSDNGNGPPDDEDDNDDDVIDDLIGEDDEEEDDDDDDEDDNDEDND